MYQKIIIKPILTEKMAILEERENKFAFLVSPDANKTEIKKAKEGLKYPALTYPKVQDIKNVEVIKIKVNQ